MDNFFTSGPTLISFKQIYAQNITPKLQEIDLFLKTSTAPYTPLDVAKILQTSEVEIKSIMLENDISSISHLDFFTIVTNCSSYISRLITRQWKYVYTNGYTAPMIADIYELNVTKVLAAFQELEVESISEEKLMDVFSRIHTPVFTFSSC
ncbi:MAG: hypothetical protein ACRC1P_01955 [Cellulosilyticaceae bacterium]